MDDLNVCIKKSEIPIIWLDTSAIIRLTKISQGENLTGDIEQERYKNLYAIINEKAIDKKILCPKGEQEEEIIIGRRLIDECRRTMTILSMGINFVHRDQILRNQMYFFIKAYVEKNKSINLDYTNAFFNDPVSEVNSIGKFIITANYQITEDDIQEVETRKNQINSQLETLRQNIKNKGITFNDQLKNELMGFRKTLSDIFQNHLEKQISGEPLTFQDTNQAIFVGSFISLWKHCKGKPNGLDGLLKFLSSDYYQSMPEVDISCRLYADILTDQNPVKTGDTMDIQQISTIMPYCSYILVDKAMKHRLIKMGLDKKYNTKVYSIKDATTFIEKLKQIV